MQKMNKIMYDNYQMRLLAAFNLLCVRVCTSSIQVENYPLRIILGCIGYMSTLMIVLISVYFVQYYSDSFKPTIRLIFKMIKRDLLVKKHMLIEKKCYKTIIYTALILMMIILVCFIPVSYNNFVYAYFILLSASIYFTVLYLVLNEKKQRLINVIVCVGLYVPFCLPYLFEAYTVSENLHFLVSKVLLYLCINTFIAKQLGDKTRDASMSYEEDPA